MSKSLSGKILSFMLLIIAWIIVNATFLKDSGIISWDGLIMFIIFTLAMTSQSIWTDAGKS